MKKHVSQMTGKEIKYLSNRFKSVPQHKWNFCKYSKERAISRGVDMAVFRSLWTDGFDLIEFHRPDGIDCGRILVRSKMTDKNDNQVCVVVNLKTNTIVTAYLNHRKNKHDNLVLSAYDRTLDIKQLMKSCS